LNGFRISATRTEILQEYFRIRGYLFPHGFPVLPSSIAWPTDETDELQGHRFIPGIVNALRARPA
jgi:hypothetical protein